MKFYKLKITIPLVFILLAGCMSINIEPSLNTFSLSELSIQKDDIKSNEEALFGISSLGSRVADFKKCHVVLTRSAMYIVIWKESEQVFKKELVLDFSQIDSVALVHFGNSAQLRQIHLTTDLGKLILSYRNGETSIAENVYAHLMDAGLASGSDEGFVSSGNDANKMVPLFLPFK